jgi:hypothetical protein
VTPATVAAFGALRTAPRSRSTTPKLVVNAGHIQPYSPIRTLTPAARSRGSPLNSNLA